MAQKGYLRNGPIEVWHCAADFRMFLYHGHRNEARRQAVGRGRKCTLASVESLRRP
jgi:hypothetical protein